MYAYRMLYLREHGPTDLPELDGRIVVSMSTQPGADTPPPTVIDDIRQAEKIAKDEVVRRRGEREAVRATHVSMVDDALAYVLNQMEDERIRASLRDLPALLKARSVLTGEANQSGKGGVLAHETVRVKQARSSGGSVYTAMRQDLVELDVILGALEAREEMERDIEAAQVATGTDGEPGLKLVE